MNIVVVAWLFKPERGGIQEATHQLAAGLTELENNVVVLAHRAHSSPQADCSSPYSVIPCDLDPPFSALRRFLVRFRTIRDAARMNNVDWICSNSYDRMSFAAAITAMLLGLRYCICVNGLDINRSLPALKRFRRFRTLRRAAVVICNSRHTRSLAIRCGVRPSRCKVVWRGTDLDVPIDQSGVLSGKERTVPGERVLLSIGRLVERKGFDAMIRSLKHVVAEFPDTTYVIAGEGPDRDCLAAIARESGIETHVRFVGGVSEEDKRKLLSTADVFVMPNRELLDGDVEGFGLVFLEAGAFGVPVIGGASGGVPDAIVDGETGFLVDPEDLQSITRAVISLLQDPKRAARFGQNARRRVVEEFTWRQSSLKLIRALAGVSRGAR